MVFVVSLWFSLVWFGLSLWLKSFVGCQSPTLAHGYNSRLDDQFDDDDDDDDR